MAPLSGSKVGRRLVDILRNPEPSPLGVPAHSESLVVWKLSGQTRHYLQEEFPLGFLLLSALSSDSTAEEEKERCLLPQCQGTFCKEVPEVIQCGQPVGPQMPRSCHDEELGTLDEEAMTPVGFEEACHILSRISKHQICLSLPLLILVGNTSTRKTVIEKGSIAPPAFTTHIGVRTRTPTDDENTPPSDQVPFFILEKLRIQKPMLQKGEELTCGDLLKHVQNCSLHNSIEASVCYDLRTLQQPKVAGLSLESPPQDVLCRMPGPFATLQLSWTLQAPQCFGASIFPKQGSHCAAMVYLRCGHESERSSVAKQWRDLHLLRMLASTVDSVDSLVASEPMQSSDNPDLLEDGRVEDAVREFFEAEQILCTAGAVESQALSRDAWALVDSTASSTTLSAAEERVDRDFADRLWLKVLSRCYTLDNLVESVQVVMDELGDRDGSFWVRAGNQTEMAESVRQAVRLAHLRRYGNVAHVEELDKLSASWKERSERFSRADQAVALALGVGLECMREDYTYAITSRRFATPGLLTHFLERSLHFGEQVSRLTALHHLVELVSIATSTSLGSDATRRLVDQAAEYYREHGTSKGHCQSETVPVFAVSMSEVAAWKLRTACENRNDPASCTLRCGGASVHIQRQLLKEGEEVPVEQGAWIRPSNRTESDAPEATSPFVYQIVLLEKLKYVRQQEDAMDATRECQQ